MQKGVAVFMRAYGTCGRERYWKLVKHIFSGRPLETHHAVHVQGKANMDLGLEWKRMTPSALLAAVHALRKHAVRAERVACRQVGDLCLVFWEDYHWGLEPITVFAFMSSSPGTIFSGPVDSGSEGVYDLVSAKYSWELLEQPTPERCHVDFANVLLVGGTVDDRGFFDGIDFVIPVRSQTYRVICLDVSTQWRLCMAEEK